MPWAGEVVRRSENCTIRLIVLRGGGTGAARQSVINAFRELEVTPHDQAPRLRILRRWGLVAVLGALPGRARQSRSRRHS
ncbi:hypothetical protein [Streptomyces lutosisoli]|uniref:Uncharacterized protein n=1 Tax=Streptomyces lutosisoli TaxID=2665721 RepID=A0ABW2VH77_9ACTN